MGNSRFIRSAPQGGYCDIMKKYTRTVYRYNLKVFLVWNSFKDLVSSHRINSAIHGVGMNIIIVNWHRMELFSSSLWRSGISRSSDRSTTFGELVSFNSGTQIAKNASSKKLILIRLIWMVLSLFSQKNPPEGIVTWKILCLLKCTELEKRCWRIISST